MIWKFFTTMHVVDYNGMIHKATWGEKISWIKQGCRLRDEKVCRRYSRMKLGKSQDIKNYTF